MRIKRLLVLAILLSVSCCEASAASQAQTVKVGDPGVDGSFLKPYKNAWKVVYTFPGKDPMLIGVWTDQLSEVEVNGRHLLKREQSADYAKYHIVTTNTNVFDPKTMAPVSNDFSRSDTGERVHRNFDGANVQYRRGKGPAESGTETGEIKMDQPIFDYDGGMYGLLLSAFPLKEGFSATIPALSEDKDAFEWVTFNVGKEELVEAGPDKQVRAFRVIVDDAKMDHSIFWVSKEAPYVIKLVNIIPTGGWVTVTLTMM